MDAQALHTEATTAAQKAVDDLIAKYGESSNMFGCCGFAWVKIRPARGPFVKFLKDNNLGDKSYNGGYEVRPEVTYPAGCVAWQSIEVREAASRAYAKVLKDAGINAFLQSMVD